jgi:hypothetical protein
MSNNHFIKTLLIYTVIASLLLSGCAGASTAQKGVNYIYTYAMKEPVKSDQLIFRDNYIYIQFNIDQSAISFQMQNLSGASMSIVWEKVSIGVNKRTFSVRNTGNFYSLGQEFPSSVVIPPLGYIRETIIPRENIYMEKGEWVEKDLFLTNDRGYPKVKKAIASFVGSEVTLSIPVKVGEIVVDYPFTFSVSKISALPARLLPPVKERPPVPKTPFIEAAMGSSVVPVVIAAGVLGVAIYLLSQKKTPAADL